MQPATCVVRAAAIVTLATGLALSAPTLFAASGEPWRVHALVDARVVVGPGQVMERATVIVRDGMIEAVGPDLAPPPDARVWNLAGKSLYPGLIDAYVGASRLNGEPLKKTDAAVEPDGPRETPRNPGLSHTLSSVRPERDLADELKLAAESVEKLRNLGFVAASVVPEVGIFRGRAAVVSLGSGSVNRSLLKQRGPQVLAMAEQVGEYPGSLMGVISVMRQTWLDAGWYRDAMAAWSAAAPGRERPEASRALESLRAAAAGEERVVLDALRDPVNVTRGSALAREFGLDLVVVGTGGEYKRLQDVSATGLPLLLPLDFPDAPQIGDDVAEWELVATEELRHWKRAPSNPRWLHEAGVRFALTTDKLKDASVFPARLRLAIDAGLPRAAALAALTTVPAELLGVSKLLGTIEKGKVASLLVASGELFAADTLIESVWVDGDRFETGAKPAEIRAVDPAGTWLIQLEREGSPAQEMILELTRDELGALRGGARSLSVGPGAKPLLLRCAELIGSRLQVVFEGARFANSMDSVLVADVSEFALTGSFDAPGALVWSARAARLLGGPAPEPRKAPWPVARRPLPDGGPIAQPGSVLVKNATVWTSGPQGVLENADLWIAGGRIAGIGRGLVAPGAVAVIDATGKHVTPGLVDAHSHTAISGHVNECTQSVTAEVRIGDVVNPEDWNLYSELAGGLTVANQLHGSCNAIGGQSQTIKLRWGLGAEALKFAGAKPGIKFALGENVKQSNWGDKFVVRYPQTRMGVEQVIRERFLAARDYQRKWDEHRSELATNKHAIPPRRDIELETLGEILRGERLIHCHSYRQSELMMMLDVTREMGITIGTFQHVLDGYKVADEMAAQGVGASTFSDWWAYKFEVYDAMPWNGALMWDRGVVVSFNSDSNDLARRLNAEAAKAVKYGGLPEPEALKFVTLNPALQLRIDDRVGSLEPGKDGDFVIWDSHPLSALAHAEQTWIDGVKYFDRAVDLAARGELQAERRKLIAEATEVMKAKPALTGPGGGYRALLGEQHRCEDNPMEVGR